MLHWSQHLFHIKNNYSVIHSYNFTNFQYSNVFILVNNVLKWIKLSDRRKE